LSYTKYRVFLEKKAEKQLESLTPEDRRRVTEKILTLEVGFAPGLDIKKLKGYKNHFRLRVGDFRVLFELRPQYRIGLV
jgi:mRNA interferase RelE/StbE